MAVRQSKQSFQITRINVDEINDAMKRIQDELDRLAGLRGVIISYDSTQYVDEQGHSLHGWGVKP